MATTTTASPTTRTFFDALNEKDLGATLALIADDTVDNFVDIEGFRDKPAIGLFSDELLAAFPFFPMTVGGIMSPGASDPEDEMGRDDIEWGPSCTAWETRVGCSDDVNVGPGRARTGQAPRR